MGNLNLATRRIKVLIVIILVFFTFFAARLVQIQAIQAGEYRSKAVSEMQSTRVIPAPRGEILPI